MITITATTSASTTETFEREAFSFKKKSNFKSPNPLRINDRHDHPVRATLAKYRAIIIQLQFSDICLGPWRGAVHNFQ
jgi:hypothetical protein